MENAPDAILVITGDGSIYSANLEACKLFGYEKLELNGKTLTDLIPSESRQLHAIGFSGYMNRPETQPLCFSKPVNALRKDGEFVSIKPDVSSFHTDQGTFMACVIRRAESNLN
jgi:PAS domain S-box-containing protein